MIQGHVDMVCEKEKGSDHDSADPSSWRSRVWLGQRDDFGRGQQPWRRGRGPLEMPRRLPPIEGLFTVAEEIGLVSMALDESMVEGRVLLNCDAEDWPNVYVGCARRITITTGAGQGEVDLGEYEPTCWPLAWWAVTGRTSTSTAASAVKVLSRALDGSRRRPVLVQERQGDKQHNVIPRTSEARVSSSGEAGACEEVLAGMRREFELEYGVVEKSMTLALSPAPEDGGGRALEQEDCGKIIALLSGIPHGPIKFSHSVPGMVETSNNIASIKPLPVEGDPRAVDFAIMCSTRSSVPGAIESVRGDFRSWRSSVARPLREQALPRMAA